MQYNKSLVIFGDHSRCVCIDLFFGVTLHIVKEDDVNVTALEYLYELIPIDALTNVVADQKNLMPKAVFSSCATSL